MIAVNLAATSLTSASLLSLGDLIVPSTSSFARSAIASIIASLVNLPVLTMLATAVIILSSSIFAASFATVFIVEVGKSTPTCSRTTSTHAFAAPSLNLSVTALTFSAITAISASILNAGLDTVPSARYFARSAIVSTVKSLSRLAVLTASPNVSTTASSSIFAASFATVFIVEVGKSTPTCSRTTSTHAFAAPSLNLSVTALTFSAITAISASMLKPGLDTVPSARY